MAIKYFEIQEGKEVSYRKLVRPDLMEHLKEKIFEKIVVQKKYKDSNYTARILAEELQTNVRYISAVIRVQFHTNYSTFVNRFRVEEAMSLLANQRYEDYSIEDIGDMVGFVHRQSFHTAFLKYAGMTPKAYRKHYETVALKDGKRKESNKLKTKR